ncbi:MAG: acyl-CoA-binding protein [Gammaproteobacteria bacterium]|jgi:diazepam-binding inhibitor (GABA receptor modulating acyl-CoA-binding protein)|nr:acyl-CoA-binding protein [Gammaproteobacteria bacterium]
MHDLEEQFAAAAAHAQTLQQRPDNDTMLELYALYKQATAGDVRGDKPGMFNFVAAAKYAAWEKLKGTSQEQAKQTYIDLVKRLQH